MPIDDILLRSRVYEEGYDHGDLSAVPKDQIAVVMCMDARLRAFSILGIHEGDANIIRNAGGVVTDDVVRSLIISQRRLGTKHIVLVHHTDCGMTSFTDDEIKDQIRAEVGMKPSFSMESFTDPDDSVRESMARLRSNPFIPNRDSIHGFVFDVVTGHLHAVQPAATSATS